MALINSSYLKLTASYLFSDIRKRVQEFEASNQDKRVIKLGIGDVTEPLPKACLEALHAATDDMGNAETFRGYGPEQGYDFLREAIAAHDYVAHGVSISPDEIFVSDGSKCDCGNIQEIFSTSCVVGIPDPVYPVYLDSNVMAGRSGENVNGRYEGICYLDTSKETGYLPRPPASNDNKALDLIYLCSPNNPTGAVFTRSELEDWVSYAKENRSIILFDAAYAEFISDSSMPRSIFEIEGAKELAIEFRSFSKNAGFTGTRCAYTVVPKECTAFDESGSPQSVHALWFRRQSTKFNAVSYPIQKAAAAVYSKEGKEQTASLIKHYMDNAALIMKKIEEMGYTYSGGTNSPYVWVDIGGDSWAAFDRFLNDFGIVCTPGVGFGKCGEGFIRFSAFNSRENVEEAMNRIS